MSKTYEFMFDIYSTTCVQIEANNIKDALKKAQKEFWKNKGEIYRGWIKDANTCDDILEYDENVGWKEIYIPNDEEE